MDRFEVGSLQANSTYHPTLSEAIVYARERFSEHGLAIIDHHASAGRVEMWVRDGDKLVGMTRRQLPS